MNNFEIGEKVIFVNETGFGFVSEIKSNGMVMVEDEDGFEREYEQKDLIVQDESQSITYDKSFGEYSESKDKKPRKSGSVKQKGEVMEIDLHIEELIDDHRGWSNSEILNYQIEKFEKVLNKAFQVGTKKIVVIHGRGDGVLRYEIRRKLHDYPGIEVYDARWKTYGQGATEILIRR